jgi:hypothetical protein
MLSKLRSMFGKRSGVGAASPTNWAVLVRSDGSDPTAFVEIRQNVSAVWTARGEPFTLGQKQLIEFQSPTEAEALFRQTILDDQARGFTILHSGQATSGHCDFKLLEDVIYRGAGEDYQRICMENSSEKIVGFSLITDFDGMTICPAAVAEGTFSDHMDEADEYTANPAEWPYSAHSGLLLAYRMIVIASYEYLEIPFESEVPDYFDQFSECCIRALERLDAEGRFGAGADRKNFLLLFGVSDGGPTRATVRRLNPDSVYQRYAHCFDE